MDQPAKAFIAIGHFIVIVALVRLYALLRGSFSMHPKEASSLFRTLGYPRKPNAGELFRVGYRYAFLRRDYAVLKGTAVERERTTLAIWYGAFFVGVALGIVGAVMGVSKWVAE